MVTQELQKAPLRLSAATKRPPIVAVMGHIDHGKSSLLDCIRKTKVVETEAGGITQHVSAYEVIHKNERDEDEKITFIDTPGHEAFAAARSRGATVADMAILVVATDDGVNTQTIEAFESIKETKTPFIVALTKIDKPDANIEQAKSSLVENGIYIEGYGGDVPYAAVSSKTGEGINGLLETILLLAEVEGFQGERNTPAEGIVLESGVDPKKGISATLLIKNGTLKKGSFVVSQEAYSPVRIMEDFQGNAISEASFSSPVKIIGFGTLPKAGAPFQTVLKKKEAEKLAFEKSLPKETLSSSDKKGEGGAVNGERVEIPIVIKTDALGTGEGVLHEIQKLDEKYENIHLNVISTGIGDISENDVRSVSGSPDMIILGFHVALPRAVEEIALRNETSVKIFDIIYNMTEWLEGEMERRKPRLEVETTIAKAKIQRVFSRAKSATVAGGKVLEGVLETKARVKIFRREAEIGKGKIVELQHARAKAEKVEEGVEFGVRIETKTEIAPGDAIEAFVTRTE